MSPLEAVFALRLVLAALLYAFLGGLLWYLARDLRGAARTSQARTQRLGRLTVVASDLPALGAGHHYPLLAVSSLGRAPTNTVAVPDDTCSLEHALLHLRDGQWWLEDLDSRNGTRLNDAPVTQPTPVLPGDVIAVGQVKLKLELD
ncbi:MAG: FHA domain-containing protein [Anaerolineales bacterium]|nr:FHA domain-containing protein [Anaerolineales bacterium]